MTRKLSPYEPKEEDLAWARNVIALCRDGGVVGTSDGTYRVDKTNKVFRLTSPKLEDNFETFVMHHRHHYVWKALGWIVEPVIDWDNIELPDEIKK